jgi:hypothetical protein
MDMPIIIEKEGRFRKSIVNIILRNKEVLICLCVYVLMNQSATLQDFIKRLILNASSFQ